MDPDENGGSCPRCDGEFGPGVLECPDCRIPLIGVDADAGPAPAARPTTAWPLDPSWAPRLVVFALACVATVVLQVAGTMLAAFASSSPVRTPSVHDRTRLALQSVTPTLAVLALLAGLAVAGAFALGDRRTWVRTTTFATAAALGALGVGKAVVEVLWHSEETFFGQSSLAASILLDSAVVLTCAAAMWLVEGRRSSEAGA